MCEISDPLFFASAKTHTEVLEEIGLQSRVLVLRIRHVSFIDVTGLHNLKVTIRTVKNKTF